MRKQEHGFIHENNIINLYSMKKEKGYTAKFDAYKNNIPVQIKLCKLGSEVCFSDLFSNISLNQDFYLIISFWKKNKLNVVKTNIFYINHKEWISYFNKEVAFEIKRTFKKYKCKSKAEQIKTKIAWRNYINKMKKEWNKKGQLSIQPRFKRDSKGQLRIQCASKDLEFIEKFKIDEGSIF